MNRKETERRIKRSFENAAPDRLDDIKKRLDKASAADGVVPMHMGKKKRLRDSSIIYTGVLAAVAAVLLIVNGIMIVEQGNRAKKEEMTVARTLTLDLELQKRAFKAIRKMEGSLVVLEVKTGRILALASSPSYDSSSLEEKWDEINSTEGALLANAFKNPVVPGSVFKLVTSTEILEAGIEDEIVNDQGSYRVNGQTIRNYQGKAYGRISFEEAFIRSSNVYFMDRAVKLGSETMEKTAKRFLLGEDIPLDFTTLRSSFSLGKGEDNVLASTAFGQGETMITPLHMAMITQSVANGGEMLKPYLILKKTNGKGKDIYIGESRILARTMSEMTAFRLKEVMTEAGRSYGLALVGDEGYEIAAKTGTAQRGDGTNNAWMVSFAPADDPRYVVVACRLKTDQVGKKMGPVIEKIYDWLLRQ